MSVLVTSSFTGDPGTPAAGVEVLENSEDIANLFLALLGVSVVGVEPDSSDSALEPLCPGIS